MANDSFIQQADTLRNKVQSFAFCLALSAAVFVSMCFVVLSDGRVEHLSEIGLESRINPNYAPQVSLSRLPGVGRRRADDIVAYRESFGGEGRKAFQNCADLQRVKGIGPRTAANMCEWLKFE